MKKGSLTHRARYGNESGPGRLQPASNAQQSLQYQRSHRAFLNTTSEHLILYYKLAKLECLPKEDRHQYQSQFKLLSSLDPGDIDRNIPLLTPNLASSEIERILVDYCKNVICRDSVHIHK